MNTLGGLRSALLTFGVVSGIILSPSIARASENVEHAAISLLEGEFGEGDRSWLSLRLGKENISNETLRIAGDEWERAQAICTPVLQKDISSGKVIDLTGCTIERDEEFDRRMIELGLMEQQK